MKKLISERSAAITILTLLSIFLVFHFLVMLGVIPFEIVWGGRLTDRSQMLRSETVSVIVNLIMIVVVAVKANVLKVELPQIFIKVILWLMFLLFLLNTLGNVFSLNKFEQLVFTPVTLILSLLSLRLALEKNKKTN
jgi:hypothetical protein